MPAAWELKPAAVSLEEEDTPNPLLLPVATTSQVPLTAAYDALDVPSLAAGEYYYDPTTNVKIWKLTSATYPTAASNWGHDYAEGGDEISLPYNGTTRSVLVCQNGGAPRWLVDFTPGVGVSNARVLSGTLAPTTDTCFTFSNNPSTPQYAYVKGSSDTIRRVNIATMAEASGDGWPVASQSGAKWLHQSKNDGLFVWLLGGDAVGYEPSTTTLKQRTFANINEPRIDREGRYVGVCLTPGNILVSWDWLNDEIVWTNDGDVPFAHCASLRRRWIGVNWNLGGTLQFTRFKPDVVDSDENIGGPSVGDPLHGNGNWVQPDAGLDDQWAVLSFDNYQAGAGFLAPGGICLITANGGRRLLAHHYGAGGSYEFTPFCKFSPDGKYIMFTSDMHGAGRYDVFLAELPLG